MSEQELRERLAKNLTEYRRLHGLKQAELAEKLNYSDKSVSKWERGEGLPDVYVLTRLAALYGVTVDDLLSDRAPRKPSVTFQKLRRQSRLLITLLSVGLVWLVAVLCFFFLGLFVPSLERSWLIFLFALPPSFIVLEVFSALWGGHPAQVLAVSGLTWSIAVCVDVALNLPNLYLIYVVAAVLQVLVVLWFFLRLNAKKKGG